MIALNANDPFSLRVFFIRISMTIKNKFNGYSTDMICSSDSSQEKLKQMEASFLAFGAGSRICLGRNISWIEMYKIVPQLLRAYSITLSHPEKEWAVRNIMFVQIVAM